jgi:hypothetical protein
MDNMDRSGVEFIREVKPVASLLRRGRAAGRLCPGAIKLEKHRFHRSITILISNNSSPGASVNRSKNE